MRVLWVYPVVVILLLVVFAPSSLSNAESHTVAWIVDGDTIYVTDLKESVRIANIDAPEHHTVHGQLATNYLIDTLYGHEVLLDCDGVDKYDRHLCLVEHHGVDVGEKMIELGYARRWR